MKRKVPRAHLMMFCVCICALVGGANSAWATLKGNIKEPIKIGSFLVKPTLKLQQLYTDNVRAAPNNEKGAFATIITPHITIEKNIRDHEFELQASTQIKKHINASNENTVDGRISLSSLLVARRSLKIPLSISYDKGHVARYKETSISSPAKPTRTNSMRAEGGFIYQPNRLRVEMIGHYAKNRYSDGALANGVRLVRSDDDYNEIGLNTKISYNTQTNLKPFLKFKTRKANFERRSYNGISFNGAARDHSYNSAMAGIGFDQNIFSGHVAAGYNTVNYSSGNLKDLDAMQISANLVWQPTQSTDIALNLSRTATEDSTVESAYINHAASISFDYELQRDLSLNANTALHYNDYKSGRDDRIYQGQVGLNYSINPAIQAHANITSRKRESDEVNADYLQNILMLGITGNL